MKHKLLVVFPKADSQDSTHYPYWYRVFEEAGKILDIYVLFESGKKDFLLANCKVCIQKWQIKPINLIERYIRLVRFRLMGYKKAYVHASIWGSILAKLAGYKTYLWDCEYYNSQPENGLHRFAIRFADVLVTGHEKIAQRYRELLKLENKPIKIVSNWAGEVTSTESQVPSSELKTISNKHKNIRNQIAGTRHSVHGTNILFLHTLSPRKGSRLLPEIIQKTIEKRSDVHFRIVGDGPDRNWLEKELKNRKLEEYSTLVGAVSKQEALNEFSQADIFIMPSLREGFPRVILEAQAAGLPYVAFDTGCVRDISPKSINKYIIELGDLSQFNQAIFNLLKLDQKEKKHLANSLLKNISKYHLDHSVKQFNSLF